MGPPKLPGLHDGIETSLIVETPDTKLENRQGVRDGLRIRSLSRACVTIITPTLSLVSLFLSPTFSLYLVPLYNVPLRFTAPHQHFLTLSLRFIGNTFLSLSLFHLFINNV